MSTTLPAPLPPGVYALDDTTYHADQISEQPSLSASIAVILCTQSPRHAWTAHPRLNPQFKREEEHHFDIGTAAHALLLEGRNAVEICEFADWRTNAAKEARDNARAQGRIPLLGKHWDDVDRMVDAVREQLYTHNAQPRLFTDGKPEQTLVWDDNGVTCRARLDWLRDDLATIDDFKTTSRSSNADEWRRGPMISSGAYIKAAFYLRGVRAVTGAEPVFRWCVIETSPPYVLSVVEPGADVLAVADDKVRHALTVWRRCLEDDVWPGYSADVQRVELPSWVETQWLERQGEREAA